MAMRVPPIRINPHIGREAQPPTASQAAHLGRRRFVQSLTLAGVPLPILARAADSKTLNFVSYGGSYGAAVQTHFVTPFEEQTGIKVSLGVNSSLSPIKIQVLSKNVQWDLAEVNGGEFVAGLKDDLFEPI